MTTDIRQLATLDEVQSFVAEGYRASGDPNSRWNRRGRSLAFGFEWGCLPLAVAEPGPLIEHAVRLAGAEGLTLQEARRVFKHLGTDRFERGLKFARDAGSIDECREKRPNSAGRLQEQVVLRTGESSSDKPAAKR